MYADGLAKEIAPHLWSEYGINGCYLQNYKICPTPILHMCEYSFVNGVLDD